MTKQLSVLFLYFQYFLFFSCFVSYFIAFYMLSTHTLSGFSILSALGLLGLDTQTTTTVRHEHHISCVKKHLQRETHITNTNQTSFESSTVSPAPSCLCLYANRLVKNAAAVSVEFHSSRCPPREGPPTLEPPSLAGL